jgi:hypothetical protein
MTTKNEVLMTFTPDSLLAAALGQKTTGFVRKMYPGDRLAIAIKDSNVLVIYSIRTEDRPLVTDIATSNGWL